MSSSNGSSKDGSGSNGSSNGGKEIHILTDETADAFRDFYSRVKKDFEAETDYTVKMEYAGLGDTAANRIAELLQANDPPELYQVPSSVGARFLNQGALAPVSTAFDSIQKRFGKPANTWRLNKDGDDYLAPLWGNSGISWYRTDVWGEDSPSTWDEVLEGAKKNDGEKDLHGAFVPAGKGICTDYYLLGWAYSNNATVCARKNEKITTVMTEGENRQRWIETLEFVQKLHKYSPKNSDAGCSQMSQSMSSNTTSFSWYLGSRPKNQCVSQDKAYQENIAAQVQPTPESGMGPSTSGLAEGFVTFKGANSEAANEYLDFLFQPKYLNTVYFLSPLQNLPAFPEIRETDKYQENMQELTSGDSPWTKQDVKASQKSAQNFKTLATETTPANPYAGAILSSRELSNLMFDITVKGTDPEKALTNRESEIQSLIENARN